MANSRAAKSGSEITVNNADTNIFNVSPHALRMARYLLDSFELNGCDDRRSELRKRRKKFATKLKR
jgi:hypothetical protein